MEDATTAPEIEPAADVEPLVAEAATEPMPEPADVIAEPDTESVPDESVPEELEPGSTDEPADDLEGEAADMALAADGSAPAPAPALVPLTLDELVADMAKSEEVAEEAPTEAEAEPEPEPEVEEAAAESAGESSEEAVETLEAPKPLARRLWTRAPFWAVDFIWLVLTVASTIVLWRAPAATFADGPSYTILVLGGAALAFIGLVTGLVVWLLARSRAEEDERVGLGLTIWTRALAWTAGGVALWWVGLLLLDMHHAGVIA